MAEMTYAQPGRVVERTIGGGDGETSVTINRRMKNKRLLNKFRLLSWHQRPVVVDDVYRFQIFPPRK